jgi:Fe-S-cluster containining protein
MWNPCLTCGACCAFFRASFYWSEADPTAGGLTPPELTTRLTPHHAVMRGTETVRCVIHPLRPSPCREFQASWVDGLHNERCDRARAAHGLPPLSPPGDSR